MARKRMTRKDFVAAGMSLREMGASDAEINRMADFLATKNPLFDRQRFRSFVKGEEHWRDRDTRRKRFGGR